MTTPVWYIQDRSDREINTQNLIYAIQELGMEVYCEKYIPFDGMDYSFLPTNRPLVAHGSISGIRHLLKQSFYPGAWCDFKKLSCRAYYTQWGEHVLQEEYAFYTLGEILRLKDFIFKTFGEDGRVFIRPDENDKEFTGEVVHQAKFDMWWQLAIWHSPPMDMLCVVSKPKDILAEHRLIIADGKVVAGSGYREDKVIKHTPHYPQGMVEFAEKVAAIWSPHPIYCLDVATVLGGYKVVECGSVNCAGYYSCDLRKIVEAASAIAVREWEDVFQVNEM